MDDLSKPYRRWFQLDMFGPDCRCPKGPHFGFPNSLGWSMHAPKDNPLSELEAENDCPTAAAMPRSDINYSHYMEGNQNLQGIKQSRAMYNVQFDPSEDGALTSLICPNDTLYPIPIFKPANCGPSLIHSLRRYANKFHFTGSDNQGNPTIVTNRHQVDSRASHPSAHMTTQPMGQHGIRPS
ncbi:hypothetical protein GBA52_008008 [Prunus armeniaca]|nr:hypothetical protein GBA52_008008 [Prunus armeniaca]